MPPTEEALLANLRRASRGRTIVIVTHRLGALAIADRVLCLAEGHIVQEGKPGQIAAWTRAQRPPSPGLAAASVTGLRLMLRRLRTGTDRYAEFLPDAEGLVERNHSPAAGLLILAVAAIFAGLIGWAGLTEVEQVVRAGVRSSRPAGSSSSIIRTAGGSPRSTSLKAIRLPPASPW